MRQRRAFNRPHFQLLAAGLASLAFGLPESAMAQVKVVDSSGSAIHPGRPSVLATGKAGQVDARTMLAQLSTAAGLPFELRQVANRYPVTLFAQKGCDGCDAGRQYLRQRGIPFDEKVVNDGDGQALERATGSKQLPALSIGNQVLLGFSTGQWASYLDAAGYPKQSRLPATYGAPVPTPLVADPAPAPATPPPVPPPPVVAPPPAPGGIRF